MSAACVCVWERERESTLCAGSSCTSLPQVIVSLANLASWDVRRSICQHLNSSSSNEMSQDLKYRGGSSGNPPFSWRGVTAVPNVSSVRIKEERACQGQVSLKPIEIWARGGKSNYFTPAELLYLWVWTLPSYQEVINQTLKVTYTLSLSYRERWIQQHYTFQFLCLSV